MKRNRNLIIGIILTAAGFFALQNGVAPAVDSVKQTPSITNFTETPASELMDETCAYVWAYEDAPKLTEKLNTAVQGINPAASASAELFGENCVYEDGRSTFGAMETGFRVHLPLPVEDIANEEAFGNWMTQVMLIVTEIPREEIQGNYGNVEFWFEKNDMEHIMVRVPIQRYVDEGQEKTGAELFRMFYEAP